MGDARTKQQGSLHAVIIAVLFVALMAALGVVFYQNFIAKKEVVIQKEAPKDEKPLTERMAFNNEIYSLDYPKDWKSQIADGSTSATRNLSVTNADASIKINLIVSMAGTSAPTCIPEHDLKISYYNVDRTPVKGLTDEPVYLVESASDSYAGGYNYNIGLVPDGGSTNTAVGELNCNLGWVGLAYGGATVNGELVKPYIVANIVFPKLQPDTSKGVKSLQEIKDMLNTEDYKEAVTIIKSARKE